MNRNNNKERMQISTDFLIIVLCKLKPISIAVQGPMKKRNSHQVLECGNCSLLDHGECQQENVPSHTVILSS